MHGGFKETLSEEDWALFESLWEIGLSDEDFRNRVALFNEHKPATATEGDARTALNTELTLPGTRRLTVSRTRGGAFSLAIPSLHEA